MGCPETHEDVINQLCGLHYYPGVSRSCRFESVCNRHFSRWLKTEPEVQRLHQEFLSRGGPAK